MESKSHKKDKLEEIFRLRREFMKNLSEEIPTAIPENIDIKSPMFRRSTETIN